MPLDSSKLQGDLRAIFQKPPKDVAQTGQLWANAYVKYASDAVTLEAGSPIALSAVQPLLAQSLATCFAVPLSPPPATAATIAGAFTTFWFLPPIAFSDGGVVTAVAGTALLATALVTAWVANVASSADADQSAQRIATAIDAFTKTVIVTTPPVPVIGPIS